MIKQYGIGIALSVVVQPTTFVYRFYLQDIKVFTKNGISG
jgi:hypothetical protein